MLGFQTYRPRIICIASCNAIIIFLLLVATLGVFSAESSSPEFLVTTTADSGPGSLRNVLETVSNFADIEFDPTVFPPSQPATIQLTSGLPQISNVFSITIDASNVGVIIDGNQQSCIAMSDVFDVIIRGLQLVNCGFGTSIHVDQMSFDITIGGSRAIGVGPIGQANRIANSETGIIVLDSFDVAILGNLVGTSATGIGVEESFNIRVEDNVVSGNIDDGVIIKNSNNVSIYSNKIGTSLDGRSAVRNGGIGLNVIDSSNITIGGNDNQRNLVSGNDDIGILVSGDSSSQIKIINNIVGLNVSTTNIISNLVGINVDVGADRVLIQNNVVSGNTTEGITIESNNNEVLGNQIGVNNDGTMPFGNGRSGLSVQGASNIIGGATSGTANIVSGNGAAGMSLDAETDVVRNNIIQGNFVGTNAAADAAIPNGQHGIFVLGRDNQIGGTSSGQANIVSGNKEDGIVLGSSGFITCAACPTQGNIVEGNFIGTNASGTVSLPNGENGVALWEQSAENTIRNNTIAFNRGLGVFLTYPIGTENKIEQNSIYENHGVAIRASVNTYIENNTIEKNEDDRIELFSDAPLAINTAWEAQGEANQFLLYRPCSSPICTFEIPTDKTLTIAGGVDLLVDYQQEIEVAGQLNINGTEVNPVFVTGISDIGWAGDWAGIKLIGSADANLNYVNISYATVGLHVDEASTATLNNSQISASKDAGLWVRTSESVTLIDNSFVANSGAAIIHDGVNVLSAVNSWWGSATGPAPGDITGTNAALVIWQPFRTSYREGREQWDSAEIIRLGQHQATISDENDIDWFTLPILEHNQVITITLSNLPADYDLFLFSHLLGNSKRTTSELSEMASVPYILDIPAIRPNGQIGSIPYILDIGGLYDATGRTINLGQLIGAGTESGNAAESISFRIGNQTGFHHILVTGRNEASDAIQPYQLTIEQSQSADDIAIASAPIFQGSTESYDEQTLFIINEERLRQASNPPIQVDTLITAIDNLSTNPQVSGRTINLADYPRIETLYTDWKDNPASVSAANQVALAIKSLVASVIPSMPNLQYIVLVGEDDSLPHWRALDEAIFASERFYEPNMSPNSSISSALGKGYYLTDDFYADYDAVKWRGRELYIPDYALGRLVGSPDDMLNVINAFSNSNSTAMGGLVVGYDFLSDFSREVENELATIINPGDLLISENWTIPQLETRLYSGNGPDIVSLNMHFDYWGAADAQLNNTLLTPSSISQGMTNAAGNLIYTVGCHSGLCVPDSEAGTGDYSTDFCQAFSASGVTYIANTAYSYGDADQIGYAELLGRSFFELLTNGENLTIGEALVAAKQQYFNNSGIRSFSPYDEKVMEQITLYGLPMFQLNVPEGSREVEAEPACVLDNQVSLGNFSAAPIRCDFSYDAVSSPAGGSFFSLKEKTEANFGRPVQPKTTLNVLIDTSTDQVAHGVLFEGGEINITPSFDPAITRIITDRITRANEAEPMFDLPVWEPIVWSRIASFVVDDELQQQLVVVPGQFRPNQQQQATTLGTQRLFDTMQLSALYSNSDDFYAPTIHSVKTTEADNVCKKISVTASDSSQVDRIIIAYIARNTTTWKTVRLNSQGEWSPGNVGAIEFFVQAVDRAGNVSTDHNKGQYFSCGTAQENQPKIFLPIIESASQRGVFNIPTKRPNYPH